MNLDLNKLTCGVSLTDTEQAVLEYLLLHLDEALKLGSGELQRLILLLLLR